MIVRIRLGSSLARLALAGGNPILRLELPSDATVGDLYDRLAGVAPELAPALKSALPVLRGQHVGRDRALAPDDEVALLTPVAGG